MRVLVIEDDRGIGELVCDDLRDQGYAFDWARNGDEALELLAGFSYDLVVLDIMLPGYNGFEIIERLRGGSNKVPVLMLTACDGVEDRVKGLEPPPNPLKVKVPRSVCLQGKGRCKLFSTVSSKSAGRCRK